ncbi:MAG: alpha-galactosidase [Bacteroidia bacterium]|nr:alpha-galactosidase [Bacteroidia bacterium]
MSFAKLLVLVLSVVAMVTAAQGADLNMPRHKKIATAGEMREARKKNTAWFEAERPNPPFSFIYAGRESSGLLETWKVEHEESKVKDGRQLTVTWTDPASGLQVRCECRDYTDYPAVEWVIYFRNTGAKDTPILENVQALDIGLPSNADSSLLVHHNKGTKPDYSDFAPLVDNIAVGGKLAFSSHGNMGDRGGSPSVESLPFFDVDAGGHGIIVGLGWTGPWAVEISRATGGKVSVKAGMERIHLYLKPGEQIRGPRALVLFWNGDQMRAHNMLRRLLLDYHSPRPGGKPFTGLIADLNWGSWMTAGKHIEEINWWGDHDLPMDCYWVDAGWTDMSQGWEAHQSQQVPNKQLFPNGIRPLSDAAHKRGMKFLLWMVPWSVHPAVGIGKEHPEWLGQPYAGKEYGQMVFYGLDHGNPDINRYMIDHFSKVVSDFSVDIFRQDGGNLWPVNTDPNRQGMIESRYVEGFYGFWDGLLRNHPGLLIDNCAEGGKKIDIETISRSIVFWRSDLQASGDYDAKSNQGYNYGLFSWIPLCGGAAPMLRINAYDFRSAYCPALLMAWPMVGVSNLQNRWSKLDVNLLRRLLKEYVSVQPYLFGDFYPLTPYSIDKKDWLAWQFDRPDLGEGMLQAFRRPECSDESVTYVLHGLKPKARYEVRNLDEPTSVEMIGSQLMREGVKVVLRERPGAAVVVYKKLHSRR